MRYHPHLILLLSILLLTNVVVAQGPNTAVEKLEKLRLELIEVQGKEESLRNRAKQLEEAIQPQNIERSLAGVGSTKPEELREARRRQLEREKQSVLIQLEAVLAKHAQLQSDIAIAEVQAYHQSAQPTASPFNQALGTTSPNTTRALFIALFGGAFAAAGGVIFLVRRLRKTKP